MSETRHPPASPPQTAPVSDRRKLQNRIAQRRFRQKKALEARSANQYLFVDCNWQEFRHFHQQFPTGFNVQVAPDPAAMLSMAQRSWTHPVDQDVFRWDSHMELSGERADFFLSSPPSTDLAASSSSSTTSTATSPGYSGPLNDEPISSTTAAFSTPNHYHTCRHAMPTSNQNQQQISPHLIDPSLSDQPYPHSHTTNDHPVPQPAHVQRDQQPFEPLLHTAAKRGNCEIVKMLLDHNADINERNDKGMTALHIAIEHNQGKVVMLLLQNGVDVNATDNEGHTALSLAVNNNCEAGVRLFLLHGADPMVKIQVAGPRHEPP
ncbi:hypothetical protein B0T17DRAFT_86028 [Bombardia bombarda]|uniref:BZIP domain-containing protein n=1 Tax=Bombardia bombarda TaxID=252184 RepID=A0AA39XM88_9PEZI|nr:hypothetical protein B0T17DRAFT_86028 [Bombardia bombarda]